MKVQFIQEFDGPEGGGVPHKAGDVVDVPENQAFALLGTGCCEEIDPVVLVKPAVVVEPVKAAKK